MRTTNHPRTKAMVLCTLLAMGTSAASADAREAIDANGATTARVAAALTVTPDFDPAKQADWVEVATGRWEKHVADGVYTHLEGEAAAIRALEGIRKDRRAIEQADGTPTTFQGIRLNQLLQAEASFTQALEELRGGFTKSVTGTLDDVYCGGDYELDTELNNIPFGFQTAKADASVFYFPFGPYNPLDPTIRYTFTRTWVWDPATGALSAPTPDQDFVTSWGTTSSSSQAQLFSPTECIGNAEAYYVTYNSQTCATRIIGSSIRLWQICQGY